MNSNRNALDSMNQPVLPAGDFSSWLNQIREALHSNCGIHVACGNCIGCCCSSYFIHIKPHETEALARIHKELLFPAPGMPKGHLLMGYDKEGKCPMLVNDACIIYENRPQTCRNYDCRVFTAAGIAAGDDDKSIINQCVRQWRFSYPTEQDRDEHRAVQRAAAFIRDHAYNFPGGRVPSNPSQLAVLAIKAYEIFIKNGIGAVEPRADFSAADIANAIVEICRKFDDSTTA